MAKENPQAIEENELEIGVEEAEEERSDNSSSSEEDGSDDESSESEAESGTETVIKHTIEEVTSRKRRFEEANEGEGGDWFEKSYLLEGMINCGLVREYEAKQRWRMLSMETRKRMEEKFRDLLDEEMRIACRKAKLLRDIAAALAQVVVP